MSALQIRPFTPDDAADLRAALEITNTVGAADSPWEHPWLESRFEAFLRRGWDGEAPTPYLATVDDTPVGTAFMFLSERDNTHLAWAWLAVLPDQRRKGYGGQMFERIMADARAKGRTSIGADGWESERAFGFAARYGLERKSQAIMRRQHLAEIEPSQIQKLYDEADEVARDYELVRIAGRTPPELVDAVVELAAAINDAPTDDLDIEDEVYDAPRIRAFEAARLAQGHRLYRLAARERSSGALVGQTVVGVDGERPGFAAQLDTSVQREHRGHRLGVLLKLVMLTWLQEREPQLRVLDTWNAASNDHMIAVNEALGYRVVGRAVLWQRHL
jgi:GNAT superfamily N-acetyltransferase